MTGLVEAEVLRHLSAEGALRRVPAGLNLDETLLAEATTGGRVLDELERSDRPGHDAAAHLGGPRSPPSLE